METKRQAILTIKDKTGAWTETYLEGQSSSFTSADKDLKVWASNLVKAFNASRQKWEPKRTLVSVNVTIVEIPEVEPLDEEDYDDD